MDYNKRYSERDDDQENPTILIPGTYKKTTG